MASRIDKVQMELEASRLEVMQAEKDVVVVRQALRSLAARASQPPPSPVEGDEATDSKKTFPSETNSLKMTASKVTGIPGTAKPVINIQLSSPIESQTITCLYDPLNPSLEGSYAFFSSVEAENATITVQVADADIPLGSSAVLDVKPLTKIDVLGGVFKKVTELEVAIVANDDSTTKSAENEAVENPSSEEKDTTMVDGDGEDEFQDAKSEIMDTPTKGIAPNKLPEDEDEEKDQQLEKEDEVKDTGNNDESMEEKKGVELTDTVEGGVTTAGEDEDAVKVELVDQVTLINEVKEDAPSKEKKEDNDPENEGVSAIKDTEESGETNEETTEEEAKLDTKLPPASMLIPTCVVYFRIEFDISLKEQKDELYNLLNNASKRKAVAVDKLRKAAALLNRSKPAEEAKGGNDVKAVKSGFLNKKSTKKKSMFLVRWYEKTIGPQSTTRKLFPIAKNYIIFFGAVTLMHFQGQQLGLPPPV
mmetsp:Transcript_13532/g.20128  ORF Transcript_13532/g.20128 Transcript_13532/m.20128 type:complete len:477 (+) Transcript_13532:134-1564(+)